jgi:fibronectin-binding autotransporter adhesin
MTTFSTWNNSNGGLFSIGHDWSPIGVPNSGSSDAGLPTLSKAYTVTSDLNETLDFINVNPNATLAITGGTFSVVSTANTFSNVYNFGTITVGAASTLQLGANVSGDSTEVNGPGTVLVSGTGTTPGTIATMQINAPFMGLYGGAQVTVTANGQILGSTTGLTNFQIHDGTISGGGSIGNGGNAPAGDGLSLTVTALGTINANGGHAMVLQTGANAISNGGLIETTNVGGLTIDSQIFQNGRLLATGTGALTINGVQVGGLGNVATSNVGKIVLHKGQLTIGGLVNIGSAAAPGGTLTTTSGDTLGLLASSGDSFTGADVLSADINNYGTISVADGSTLNLRAAVINSSTGTLALNGSTGPTKLEIYGGSKGGAAVSGGLIVLSNSAQNSIISDGAGTQFSNFATIRGSGTIGDGWLRLYNSPAGRINANQAVGLTIVADALAVAAGTENANYNAGTVMTSGSGGLTIDGAFGNAGILEALGTGALTINGENLATNPGIGSGGGIVEVFAGASIVLENNAEVTSQAYISIAAGGLMRTSNGDTADIVESNLISSGAFNVRANSTAILEGTWQNSGAVNLFGSAAGAAQIEIEAGSDWTLLDGGTTTLNGFNDSIISQGAGAELRNRGNTIQGAGTIGDANMTIENDFGSIINAMVEGTFKTLTLDATAYDPSTQTTFINNGGTVEASAGATLDIDSAMFNSQYLIANSGSIVDAQDAVFGPGLSIIRGTGSIEFGAEADNDVRYAQGSGGQLILDDSAQFFGNIYQMTVGDSVDLRDFAFNSANPSAMKVANPSVVPGGDAGFGTLDGALQITNGTSLSSNLFLEGNYQSAAWTFKSDAHGGTTITLAAFAG